MSFDPTYPPTNAEIESAPLRSQFTGLKDLIDAVPPGTPGPQGPPFATAIVDGVTTLNPADPASVNVSFDGTNVRFTFGIPRGNDGPAGPPVTSFLIDAVNTVPPTDPAAVTVSFDGANVRFTFNIPRGNDGLPGEVTNAQFNAGIAGTSSNSNGVNLLSLSISDPPTSYEIQQLIDKINELIIALHR